MRNGRTSAAAVDEHPGDDDPEQVAEEEPREDPAVEVEAAEVLRDDRHDRRDGERLRRDDRDVQDEPDRERPAAGRPEAVGGVVARCGGRQRGPSFTSQDAGSASARRRGRPSSRVATLRVMTDDSRTVRSPTAARGRPIATGVGAGRGDPHRRRRRRARCAPVERVRAIAGVGLDGRPLRRGHGQLLGRSRRSTARSRWSRPRRSSGSPTRSASSSRPGETRRNVTHARHRPERARRPAVPRRRRRVRGDAAVRAVPVPDGSASASRSWSRSSIGPGSAPGS